MSNIHTLGGSSNREPIPNPWANSGRSTGSSSRQNNRSSGNTNWGGGHSVSGKSSRNPWGSEASQTERGRAQETPAYGGNIHGANDYDNSEFQSLAYQGGMPRVSLADPVWSDNLPEDEMPTFTDMCCYSCGCGCCVGPCCSDVRKKDWCNVFKMFTLWISVVELVMFIVSMCLKREYAAGWSVASPQGLLDLGAKYSPYIVHKYHIHRLLLPIILHGGLVHFLFNMLFTFRVMFYREPLWGFFPTAIVYFLSGIAGNIWSACLYTDSVGVGASGALLGIFGCFILDIVASWNKMIIMEKINYIIYIFIFLLFIVIFGFYGDSVDNAAHLGGILSGLSLGLFFHFNRAWVRILGCVFYGIVFLVPFLILFLDQSRIPIAQ